MITVMMNDEICELSPNDYKLPTIIFSCQTQWSSWSWSRHLIRNTTLSTQSLSVMIEEMEQWYLPSNIIYFIMSSTNIINLQHSKGDQEGHKKKLIQLNYRLIVCVILINLYLIWTSQTHPYRVLGSLLKFLIENVLWTEI